MDGISITIDMGTIGLLLFIIYKIASLEMRIKRIEERLEEQLLKDK